MGIPHILAIPYPTQGHVIPMMELVQRLVQQQGFKVTFVNSDINHNRVMKSFSKKFDGDEEESLIKMVSIPDGLEPWADRNDMGKLTEAILRVMPQKLEELILKATDDDDKISCVIADENMGWALRVAEKMRIKRAAFWPASAALLALLFSIPKLTEDGLVNDDGTIRKKEIVRLSPMMPAMNSSNFVWACIGNVASQRITFQLAVDNNEHVKLADWIICNSTYDLEPATFTKYPNILPIGPLSTMKHQLKNQTCYFWSDDSACLAWLDQHTPRSVIYVAFGSFTVFDSAQFKELALGLERTNKPFLWVVRPDMTDDAIAAFLEGFKDRIGNRGLMVGWSPQEKVLSHASVACFLSHCGWNSTMEGVSNGVPFLCWPYFADQFLNETYICDVWKIGLGFEKDESGIIRQGEIKNKVEQLLGDKQFKARALDLKEKSLGSVEAEGCSSKNLCNIIEWLKV